MNWIEPDWPAPKYVHAASTLRYGGVSNEPYASNNLALHVNDIAEQVCSNREQLKQALQLPSEPVWLRQVHGCCVIKAESTLTTPQADAAYTDQPGVVCVVMTADCLPVLLATSDGSVVAAVHAGWRGLLAGVVEQTVARMQRRDLLVWLGPAIGPERFEVGDDVRRAYTQKSTEFVSAFRRYGEKKWLADIYQLARVTLASLGIENIYGGGFCTVSESERFFSYRRDGLTGRMASLIWRE